MSSNKNDTLVAINLTNDKFLINPTKLPILFYWDGNNDLQTEIIKNEDINDILKSHVETYKDYINISIDYFKFEYENGEEVYKEEHIPLNSFIEISELPDDVWVSEIKNHFDYLYLCSFKETYKFTDNILHDLKDIYNKLKEKYPDKISETTIINYIRSKFESYITEKDKEYIIQKILETIS